MLPVDTKSPSCGSQLGLKAAAKRETSHKINHPKHPRAMQMMIFFASSETAVKRLHCAAFQER